MYVMHFNWSERGVYTMLGERNTFGEVSQMGHMSVLSLLINIFKISHVFCNERLKGHLTIEDLRLTPQLSFLLPSSPEVISASSINPSYLKVSVDL